MDVLALLTAGAFLTELTAKWLLRRSHRIAGRPQPVLSLTGVQCTYVMRTTAIASSQLLHLIEGAPSVSGGPSQLSNSSQPLGRRQYRPRYRLASFGHCVASLGVEKANLASEDELL